MLQSLQATCIDNECSAFTSISSPELRCHSPWHKVDDIADSCVLESCFPALVLGEQSEASCGAVSDFKNIATPVARVASPDVQQSVEAKHLVVVNFFYFFEGSWAGLLPQVHITIVIRTCDIKHVVMYHQVII